MSDGGFDPYKKWLAIPPEEQPPNHYRLLAVPLFEDDPDSIENAADQRMSHVRTFAAGKYGDLSQKLLNEISAARIVLLNREKKTAYDARLEENLAPKRLAAAPPPTALPLPTARPVARPVAARPAASQGEQFHFQPPEASSATSRLPRKKPLWQQPVVMGGVAAGLMIVVGLVVAVGQGGGSEEVAENDGGGVEPNPVGVGKDKTGNVTPPILDDGKKATPSIHTRTPDIKKPVVTNVRLHEDEVVYLDDLQETGFQVWSTWFVLGKHGLTGEKGRPDVRYEYRGANPEHGLYVVPPPNSLGQITYTLNSTYDTFETVATIPFNLFYKNKTVASPLTFKVYGDNHQLWQSQPMQEAGTEQTCRVSVKGVRDLGLEVHCPGKADLTWGAWINPRLIASRNAKLAPLTQKDVDLLKFVDPAQHVLEGDAVEFDGDTLVATANRRFVVRVPYQPTEEYDMTLVARHTDGVAGDLRVGLVGGGRPFIFTISLFHSIVGLEHLDGQIARLSTNPTFKRVSVLRDGELHTFHFQVRKQGIVVKGDGVTLVDWQEGYQRLSFPTKGPLRDTKELFFIGSGERATFRIESCRIVEHRDPADTGNKIPVPAGAPQKRRPIRRQ